MEQHVILIVNSQATLMVILIVCIFDGIFETDKDSVIVGTKMAN